MRYDIYQRLIGHVSRNEWTDAKDLFESIINQKVASRLEDERELLVEPDAEEPEENDGTDAEDVEESTPPGQESWVKANKARFRKEYGKKKGTEVLYATAWRNKNKGK